MRSALYYPHIEIQSRQLLSRALLLWDDLEVIVPYSGHGVRYSDREFAQAFELIGVTRTPKDSEKSRLHEQLEDMATRQLPPSFYYSTTFNPDSRDYQIFTEKLLHRTWDMLVEADIAKRSVSGAGVSLTENAALTVMAM